MSAATLRRERVAGVDLVRRAGVRPSSDDGEAVILLHGIGSDAGTWSGVMEALDPALDAWAWDAPGYGGSDPVAAEAPGPADYAERLLALVDGLRLERATLVGHSLGCLFAGRFAAAHPARVAGLVLLSPALGYGVPPGAALPSGVQGRIDELSELGPEVFAARRAPRLISRPDAKPEVLAGVRRAMGAVRLPGYAQAARALGAGDLCADMAGVDRLCLVAVGAEDVVTPPDGARRLQALLRQPAGFELVPDAGHALPQEEPALVARLVSDFVEAARG